VDLKNQVSELIKELPGLYEELKNYRKFKIIIYIIAWSAMILMFCLLGVVANLFQKGHVVSLIIIIVSMVFVFLSFKFELRENLLGRYLGASIGFCKTQINHIVNRINCINKVICLYKQGELKESDLIFPIHFDNKGKMEKIIKYE
jgi:hypothetical protein